MSKHEDSTADSPTVGRTERSEDLAGANFCLGSANDSDDRGIEMSAWTSETGMFDLESGPDLDVHSLLRRTIALEGNCDKVV